MEFGQGRQDYYEEEEEEIIGDINKLPFSSSSSSSPSSSQYKGVIPQLNGQWGAQIYEKEAARSFDRAVFKPIDSSPRNNDDVGIIESDGGETSGGGGGGLGCVEREHMFDKVVTPSDVGKLNRLVIPKQHAEKYFPLDSSANEKGLLLNFEDLSGKPWRFRYSYWNSSQSYVMTKGWSRFVKEKKLDAGDIVSFERGVGESSKDRLFIDWRRRPNAPDPHTFSLPTSAPWGRFFMPPPTMSMSVPERNYLHLQQQLNYGNLHHQHQHQHQHHQHPSSYGGSSYGCNVVNPGPGSVIYLRSSAPHQVGVVQQGGDVPMVFDSVPVVHGKAAAKRVRLFGVNLECPIQEDTECDILSSSRIPEHTTMASLSAPQLIPPSPLPPLQLRLFNGTPLPTMLNELPRQGKPSLSFNLDI